MSSQKDGTKLVDIYRQAGFTRMHKADNQREAGCQKVLQRLQNGKLLISKACPKLLSEMRMYARDEEGKIKDGNDHLLDALRYIVMSGMSIATPRRRRPDMFNEFEDYSYGQAGLM